MMSSNKQKKTTKYVLFRILREVIKIGKKHDN